MEAFVRHPFRLNDAVFHIGAKIGVALFRMTAPTATLV